jgi:peptidoglycan-associated lipoprotein
MKKMVIIIGVLVFLSLCPGAFSAGHGGYHGYGGYYGYHGYGGYYGHRGYYGYGGYGYYPFGYYPYGYYPYGYPYPSYAYPSYPPYPSAQSQYPTYVEPEQPFYWYYCQDPQGYYPYVESCPSGWTRVVPAPSERHVAQPPPSPPSRPTVLQPIYFDLNKSDIRPEAAKTLNENLRWFRWSPGRKVSIQGNCDPRATEKYNLALGKRRADAVKKYLVRHGVDAALLHTLSHGKDRPRCKESDESCWSRERRVDFEPIR